MSDPVPSSETPTLLGDSPAPQSSAAPASASAVQVYSSGTSTDHIAPQFVLWLCVAAVCLFVGSALLMLTPFLIVLFVSNYFWRTDRRAVQSGDRTSLQA